MEGDFRNFNNDLDYAINSQLPFIFQDHNSTIPINPVTQIQASDKHF
jgi:hypothetical protein